MEDKVKLTLSRLSWSAFVSLCLYLLSAHSISAQEKLTVNQPIARTIAAGATDKYSIPLNDGDYVGASITLQGKVQMNIHYPDGSVMRSLSEEPAPVTKESFEFAAEGGGVYVISLVNVSGQATGYELLLEKIVSLNERFRGEVWSDPYPSPRIQALRKQIASGQSNTEGFWQQIAAQGTPLVERLDETHELVTFLWRAQHDTRGVWVRGPFQVAGETPNRTMHRIGDSDVWYLTVRLPKRARFTYQLIPNYPQGSDGTERIAQADPFNPKRWDCPEGASKFRCESIAELPGAAPQSWLISKPETAKGRIEKQSIKSTIQKVERTLFVYTPAGYKADGPPNSLLFLFDGDDYLAPDWQGQTTWDNLIAARRIPPTVVVMIANIPGRRLVDLVANPEFADFVAKELVPWVRTKYNVTSKSTNTVVGGYSAGGLAAGYFALQHPEVFGNALIMSGAFWWSPEHDGGVCGAKCPESRGRRASPELDASTEPNWIAKQFAATPKRRVRFYLAAGTFEADKNGSGGAILESTRLLRDVLMLKGYEVHYQQFVGGHDDLSWRGTMADGLIALLGHP
jgi:enterochelin esterase family protein